MSNEDELSKAFDEEYIKHCALFPKSDYERGFIDGMQKQMQSSVDKAVNRMAQPEHGWTPERIAGMARLKEAQDKKLAQPEQEYHAVNAVHKGQQCYVKTKPKEPEQKPVAWMVWGENNVPSLTFTKPSDKYVFDSLYMTPPQRKPLTDEELQPIADEYRILFGSWVKDFARAIEAKLKEKNT